MKKFTSLAVAGLLVFASLSLTGCGGSGENRKVELDGTSPPSTLNQVDMENYAKEMKAQGQSNPAGN
jgi:hypothetical protein